MAKLRKASIKLKQNFGIKRNRLEEGGIKTSRIRKKKVVSLKTASEHHHFDPVFKSRCVVVRYHLTALNSCYKAKQRMLFLLDGRYFVLDMQGPEL